MKLRKKLLTLLAILSISMGMVACGPKESAPANQPAATEPAKDAAKDPAKDPATNPSEQKELHVSAAASLKDAMEEITKIYKEKAGVDLIVNLGPSGGLQKQIENGDPADVFISAGQKQMKALVEKDLMEKDSVGDLLVNDLVMIVPKDSDQVKSVEDLKNVDGVVAVGEVESVPVGQYTKEALTNLGVWDELSAQNKMAFQKDVRATMAVVDRGEAIAGFVYKSDAMQSKDSKIAETMPADSHKPIIYPFGMTAQSKDKETTKAFMEFLKSDECKQVFEKYGFGVK